MNVLEERNIESTAEERKEVIAQLNRMLESPLFKNSRRYPALLRFIVEETLDGRGEFLKERLLGISVFDRPADYDTAADPIVRVTIAEIRKRIVQFYADEERDPQIRIELLPGRYTPEFRFRQIPPVTPAAPAASPTINPAPHTALVPESQPATTATAENKLPAGSEGSPRTSANIAEASAAPARIRLRSRLLLAVAALLLLAAGIAAALHWLRPSALDQFWAPLVASPHALVFCLPTDVAVKNMEADILLPGHADGKAGRTFLDHETLGENVVYSDMLATLNMASVLTTHHHDFEVRLTRTTTLDDLRHGPSILIGGLDNQWSMRALAPLRFHFAGTDEGGYYIADSINPSRQDMFLNLTQQYAAVTRDYAIIARLHNEQTGQAEMVVAGIGMSGTAAGGEFVTNERSLNELRQRIGAGFRDHDFEVVVSTDVVNGMAGAPRIVAVNVF